jgi:hypothetical protein
LDRRVMFSCSRSPFPSVDVAGAWGKRLANVVGYRNGIIILAKVSTAKQAWLTHNMKSTVGKNRVIAVSDS